MRRAGAQSVMAGLVVFGVWTGWVETAAAQSTTEPGQFVARDVSGQSLTGALIEIDADRVVMRLNDGSRKIVPIADLVRLDAVNAAPLQSSGWRLRLVNGDELIGWPAEAVELSITLGTRDLGPVVVPLEAVRMLETQVAPDARWARRVEALVAADARDDVVLMSNGDTLSGFVSRLDHESLSIDVDSKTTRISREVVVAVRFANPPPKPPAGLTLTADLRGGERVTLANPLLHDRTLQGETILGHPVSIEMERLTSLHVAGGRWEWLSGIKPIEAIQVPLMSAEWPTMTDRNVMGSELSVAGRTFDRGIGVHSRSELTFDLGGRYREFVTSFGLDDAAGPGGDVNVRILVDGQVRYSLDHVRRGKLHGPVRIDLSAAANGSDGGSAPSGPARSGVATSTNKGQHGAASATAQRIQLIVDFGDNGDVLDRFDWIESALVRR